MQKQYIQLCRRKFLDVMYGDMQLERDDNCYSLMEVALYVSKGYPLFYAVEQVYSDKKLAKEIYIALRNEMGTTITNYIRNVRRSMLKYLRYVLDKHIGSENLCKVVDYFGIDYHAMGMLYPRIQVYKAITGELWRPLLMLYERFVTAERNNTLSTLVKDIENTHGPTCELVECLKHKYLSGHSIRECLESTQPPLPNTFSRLEKFVDIFLYDFRNELDKEFGELMSKLHRCIKEYAEADKLYKLANSCDVNVATLYRLANLHESKLPKHYSAKKKQYIKLGWCCLEEYMRSTKYLSKTVI